MSRAPKWFAIVLLLVALLTGAVAETTAQEKAEGKLEVFSWWTSGGEAAALQALFDAYKAANPNVEIVNATVAGGGGSAARGVLQTRLAGGDPPDTWQVHAGFELKGQYIDPNYVAPLTSLYEEEGWMDVTPPALLDMMTVDGNIYQVTVGVHRGNGLWYNKSLLEENGITLGETLSIDDFFKIADQLKAAGITPLCVGDSGIWTTAELFENTLLGVIGDRGLWSDAGLPERRPFGSHLGSGCPKSHRRFMRIQFDGRLGLWRIRQCRTERQR